MSSVKPADAGRFARITPQPTSTSTPKSQDTNDESGGSSTPTAKETKSSQQLATAKKEEFELLNISKTLNNALDKDRAGDVGMIRPGNYQVLPQGTAGSAGSIAKQTKQDRSPESRAREFMQTGHYREAAEALQNHIGNDAVRARRLRPLQRQAEVLTNMQDRGVQNIQHPPSEQNVRDYFSTFQGQPTQVVQQRFQNYANAYFSHSDSGEWRTGDRQMARSWASLTTDRVPDGRYQIDCEGYAYMGRIALESAGFTNIRFGDMRPADHSAGHIVVTGTRGHGNSTEIAMISNGSMRIDSPHGNESVPQARLRMLREEFEAIIQQPYGDGDRIIQNADMEAAEATR